MQYVVVDFDYQETAYGPFNSREEAESNKTKLAKEQEISEYDLAIYPLSANWEEAERNRKQARIDDLEEQLRNAKSELFSPVSSKPGF